MCIELFGVLFAPGNGEPGVAFSEMYFVATYLVILDTLVMQTGKASTVQGPETKQDRFSVDYTSCQPSLKSLHSRADRPRGRAD